MDRALPLWSTTGWDAANGCFHERLTPQLRPDVAAPRRLVVQARQVSVFAAAARDGTFPAGRALALAASDRMEAVYHRRDGRPGWIFAVDGAGEPVATQRDLYAHAFVLFALAHVLRLEPTPHRRGLVDATLAFLDAEMALPGGGYADAHPRPDALRRQNPHMHLLEALQELFLATGDARFLGRAQALAALALERFLDPRTGALREEFQDDWTVYPAAGRGRVEPGHQFEWAWLLRRQSALAPDAEADRAAELLVGRALAHGVEPETGRVLDEVAEDGTAVRRSSRLWPHCEAWRSLAGEHARGRPGAGALADRVAARLRRLYLPDALGGGWTDQLDEADRPVSTTVPASSLYHIYGAFREGAPTRGEDGDR